MPVIIPVSDKALAVIFAANIIICGALRVKLVSGLNKRIPPAERWPYLQFWTAVHAAHFDEEFRKVYPNKRVIRIIASIFSSTLLIVAVEVVRRWIA